MPQVYDHKKYSSQKKLVNDWYRIKHFYFRFALPWHLNRTEIWKYKTIQRCCLRLGSVEWLLWTLQQTCGFHFSTRWPCVSFSMKSVSDECDCTYKLRFLFVPFFWPPKKLNFAICDTQQLLILQFYLLFKIIVLSDNCRLPLPMSVCFVKEIEATNYFETWLFISE